MDLWNFSRGEEKVSVAVKGWLVSSNTHRDTAIELAIAGHGVMRILDWTNEADFEAGRLEAVLGEWEALDAPPVTLSYWPSGRRTTRVRAAPRWSSVGARLVDRRPRAEVTPRRQPSRICTATFIAAASGASRRRNSRLSHR
jgi:hypothetical protein